MVPLVALTASSTSTAAPNLEALLITGIGTALLAALAGFFGAWVQSRREIRKWQLQLRYDAYRAVLVESDFIHLAVPRSGELERFTLEDRQAAGQAVAGIGLIGPATVYRAAVEYQQAVIDLVGTARVADNAEWAGMLLARNELAIAMQKALRVKASERFTSKTSTELEAEFVTADAEKRVSDGAAASAPTVND
jgi:hypothetical protein